MFKCRNCGYIFDEGEQKTRYEKHNDYYTEPICVCPVCGSDNFDHCVYCRSCGAEHFKDELNSKGLCSECVENFINESKTDVLTCYEIGNKEKIQTEINSFIFDFFGDIESIEGHLLEYIKGVQEFGKKDFSEYLKETDEDLLSEMILGERR